MLGQFRNYIYTKMNNYNSAAVLRKLDDMIAREGAKNVGTEFIKGAEKLK